MPVTRIGLDGIFGFGLPYTLATRTPFKENIHFVGVPPQDIFAAILRKGPDGLNAVERKQREVRWIASSPDALEKILQDKISSGELDHKQQTRSDMLTSLQQEYLQWASRLVVPLGIQAMCQVLSLIHISEPTRPY